MEHDVLDIIQEIMETERSFHSIIRFLDASTRNQLVAAHMRNTNNAMALVRDFMREEPPTMVMNIQGTNFLDPVPVIPTPAQLNLALDRNVPMVDTNCVICQEAVTTATRIRTCGHSFHADCIRDWFAMNTRCPICRHDVREVTLANQTSTDTEDETNSMHSDEE